MPKLGFEFRETMTGVYVLASSPSDERPARFTLRASTADALQHLRDGLVKVEGVLELPGFAEEAAVAGTMEIRPLDKRIIRYELAFVAHDGLPYRLVGQKDIRVADLRHTMTTLPFELLGAGGQVVGRGTVRFDLGNDWLKFAASFRPLLPFAH
jgi:hypothetical protein